MDKLQYAILGWIDEGGQPSPTKLSAMLGISIKDTERRVQILRTQASITHNWFATFRHYLLLETQASYRLARTGTQ